MPPRRAQAVGLAACAVLLVLFAALSLHAVRQKSSTFDEPGDVYAAWRQRFHGDYTVIPEHPPLWTLLASLALSEDSVKQEGSKIGAFAHLDVDRETQTVFEALYGTPGVDGERLVQRARVPMLLTGVLLGLLLFLWGWEIAGPLAAVIALALFAFDPSFLGHAPLVKNDTFAALVFLAIAYATWKVGKEATIPRVVSLALLCGASFVVKSTDFPCGPISAALLLGRALMPITWKVAGVDRSARGRRVAAACGVAVVMASASVATTWAVYGFHFGPVWSSPNVAFNDERFMEDFRHRDLRAQHPAEGPTPDQIAHWKPPLIVKAIEFGLEHHLMPSAWLYGLLFMRSHTLMRESYLLGNVSFFGTWWYFPFALLVKLPLGILAAFAFACGAAIALVRTGWRADRWTLLCVGVPTLFLIVSTLASNLNIGIRHALPILPMAYLGIAVVAAKAIERWRMPAVAVSVALISATAVETLRASPNYIAFFNAAAGGSEGGIKLLGDSNLDWGQDLPLLAQWRKSHTDRPLYLSYFGFADPAVYGIDYRIMPGDSVHGRAASAPERPAYVAISVTNLQGIYLMGPTQRLYRSYLDVQPIAKLGGTIYVYDLPKK